MTDAGRDPTPLLILDACVLIDYIRAERMRGSTSFQDNICLLTAKRHGMTCITNDKSLRKACSENGVPIIWGLEPLLQLVRSGGLDHKSANVGESESAENGRRRFRTVEVASSSPVSPTLR